MKRRVTISLTKVPPGIADQLFAAIGNPSVDDRLANIVGTAGKLLAALDAGMRPHKPMEINRWAVRALDLCAQVFHRPPPIELVALIERQLGVANQKRVGGRKNREKFIAAAHYVAQHPDATPAQIARAIKYDQKNVVKVWREDQEFREIVGIRRSRLAHQQKKGT